MSQVRVERPWSAAAWLRLAALTMALAVAAGTARGQAPPTPPADTQSPEKEPAPPAPKVERSQPARVVAQAPPEAIAEMASQANANKALLYQEVLSWFVIGMFAVGGVTALAITARFFFKLARPGDPVQVALSDPWVRANLDRLKALEPGNAPVEEGPAKDAANG
jgi:hypothetical protein